VPNPVIYARDIQAQFLFATAGNRIKKTEPLDITTIATVALIRYHNVIKGALLGPAAG
jgi:hypothetical protein